MPRSSRSPHNLLNHALLILNILNLDQDGLSALDKFWKSSPGQQLNLRSFGRTPLPTNGMVQTRY